MSELFTHMYSTVQKLVDILQDLHCTFLQCCYIESIYQKKEVTVAILEYHACNHCELIGAHLYYEPLLPN